MIVGVLQVELHIPEATCLKDKRRVLRSLKDRLHREHMVAVAEVGDPDTHHLALLAISAVAPEAARVADVFDRITAKLRALTGAELGPTVREMLNPPLMGRLDEDDNESDAGNPHATGADLADEMIARGDAAMADLNPEPENEPS